MCDGVGVRVKQELAMCVLGDVCLACCVLLRMLLRMARSCVRGRGGIKKEKNIQFNQNLHSVPQTSVHLPTMSFNSQHFKSC